MKTRFGFAIALGLGIVVLILATAADAEPPAINPEQFAKLHKLIQPAEEEQAWTQIPWRSSLWEARQEAAREGKPILLWEMDGHPLGCT
jgi:hypothetical protein